MANILAVKRRIQTAQNVSKTTRAMQMIAASKLKRAQDAATLARPYVDKLTEVSQNLTSKVDKDNLHAYMKDAKEGKYLVIVLSPDKGLCGGLVSNLLRQTLSFDKKNCFFIAVGKKAETSLSSLGSNIVASFPFGTTLPSFEMVYPIQKIIDEYFLQNKVSKVFLLSTKFISIFSQKPSTTTLLPVVIPQTEKLSENVMVFEPNLTELLPSILSHYLEMVIYQNILETYASEQAARMIAMKNATDNARDIIEELKLEYNKSRQEKITNEILDIGGATFALSYEN